MDRDAIGDMINHILIDFRCQLTQWESTFLEGMEKRWDAGDSFSPAQIAKIEEIHREYCR